ncbi:hypothetical protein LCGC14_0696310 [marine sediment metagenome]|uniref:Uncharacterized protein n=1 Tax=marine sediment metagenome TaxID=412755 RepID=A0A0F9QNU1_9ZZZZ
MSSRSVLLGGDITVHWQAENNRKQVRWTGAPFGRRTLNEIYSALQGVIDDNAQMDDLTPIKADTPSIYRTQNSYFFDDETVEHLQGGSLFSEKWKDGTTEHVLIIGADFGTAFSDHDIGRTIVGGTTTDQATLLDFNAQRGLLWVRPTDPAATGDEFDDPTEAYTIQDDAVSHAWQVDDTPTDNAFVDMTTEINEATDDDVVMYPAVDAAGDYFAFGFSQEFSKIVVDSASATARVGGSVAFEYWNGTAWVAVSGLSDATTGFTVLADGQDITWTAPQDWVERTLSTSASLYWIRVLEATLFTTPPQISQAFISGQGAGNFQEHGRHGGASASGESAWVGLTTVLLGDTRDSRVQIFQANHDQAENFVDETRVVATKGTEEWWPERDNIDILLKVKEADAIFGPDPDNLTNAVATFTSRQYSKTWGLFIQRSLATTGGNAQIPLSADDDLNNISGFRNLVWDNGTTAETLVDEELLFSVGTTASGNVIAGVRFNDDDGLFIDDTTDLNSIGGGGDVPLSLTPSEINDAFYFGMDKQFSMIMMDVDTAGTGSPVVAWEYWNGSTWVAVSGLIDDTSAFQTAPARQLVSWTVPSDWIPTTISNQPVVRPLFYVRVRITTVYTIEPILETAWIGGDDQLVGRVADTAIVTPGGAAGNADYYLLGDLADFSDNDVAVALTSRKIFDIAGAPTNVGPASLGVASDPSFGQTTEDINNGNGARPYSVRLDPNSTSLATLYERWKFITRRGSAIAFLHQDGEEYVGTELQIEYTSQAGGNFLEGDRVFDQATEAIGVIVADHDDGPNGDLILNNVRGTFVAGNVVSDSPDAVHSPIIGLALQVDASPLTFTDQTAAAQSAATGDTELFPTISATGDYGVFGSTKPFALIRLDNTVGTQGVGGVVAWEYWNGTAWTDLETGHNFVDGSSDMTNATGVVTVTFSPPVEWEPNTLALGTQTFGPFYNIRARLTTAYSTEPIHDQITLEDFVTATIGSIRSITPITASPLGTFAGGTFFGAPGIALTAANLVGADVQAYQLIDDDGIVQIPPNAQAVSIGNLISGDAVAVFRRTGTVINKIQLTLTTGNNQGDSTLVMNATIPSDNPTNANSKVRVVSVSGDEQRYRYDSYATDTFTLSPASTGVSDGGNSSATRLHDTTGSFSTDEVEVGDMVRNGTTGAVIRVTNVISDAEIDTDALPGGDSWSGDSYSVNTLVQNYSSGDNAYVPFLERVADATSETNQFIYTGDLDVRVVARNAGIILPFTVDTTVVNTGLSQDVIRTPDDIFT